MRALVLRDHVANKKRRSPATSAQRARVANEGVRRVGVTKGASALHNQKPISYSRSNIEILDSTGL